MQYIFLFYRLLVVNGCEQMIIISIIFPLFLELTFLRYIQYYNIEYNYSYVVKLSERGIFRIVE